MNRLASCLVLLGASLSASAQSTQPSASAATTRPAPKLREYVRGADGSPVLIRFGDTDVTQLMIDRMISDVPPGQTPSLDVFQQYRQQETIRCVWRLAYNSYLADHPDLVSREEIEKELAEHTKRFEEGGRSFAQYLESFKLTEDEYVRFAVIPGLIDRKLVAQYADDKAITDFYNAHREDFDGTKATIRHVLIRVDTFLGTPEEHEEAQMKLAELRLQIEAGAISFEEAMRQYSDDPYVYRQPELGPFVRYAAGYPAAFTEAAFSVDPGQIAGPIRSNIGWHILQVIRHEPGTPLTLEQAKGLIREHLLQAARDRLLETQMASHPVTPYMIYQKMPRPQPPATRPATRPAVAPPKPPIRPPVSTRRAGPRGGIAPGPVAPPNP